MQTVLPYSSSSIGAVAAPRFAVHRRMSALAPSAMQISMFVRDSGRLQHKSAAEVCVIPDVVR